MSDDPLVAAPNLSPTGARDHDIAQRVEVGEHWSADEIASFVCHPGNGRILLVRAGAPEGEGLEGLLEHAGYRVGRLPVTRDTSHLPHAAATFMPHVIYVSLCQPIAPCLEALELLGQDIRTRNVPLVALMDNDVEPEHIEDAYTRSGCDFLRADATPIESLARTHLLARLATAVREASGGNGEQVRLHEPPRAGAANDDPRAPLMLLDADSGAYSARYFAQRLPAEIARATRYKRDLTVLLLSCSAAAESSAAAARITARLQEYCRETDLIARADDARFVVLLPETPAEGAATLASRVAEALAGDGLQVDAKVLAAEAPGLARILGGAPSASD